MFPDAWNPVSPMFSAKKTIAREQAKFCTPRCFMTRILIADDHEIMRRGVRSVLESHREVDICEAQNGLEAVQKTKEMKPDLVILDVSMPLLDGLGARQIKEMSPLTPILIFSLHRTEAFLEVAQKIGVSGYIAKNEDIQNLLNAVEAALHNQTYFSGLSTDLVCEITANVHE
jgi:DNA-binding NarL/FixJ family response regulator